MDKEKITQYLEVAKRYYEQGQTQDHIAKEMGLSRPNISRILQYCKDKNIVQSDLLIPLLIFMTMSLC